MLTLTILDLEVVWLGQLGAVKQLRDLVAGAQELGERGRMGKSERHMRAQC